MYRINVDKSVSKFQIVVRDQGREAGKQGEGKTQRHQKGPKDRREGEKGTRKEGPGNAERGKREGRSAKGKGQPKGQKERGRLHRPRTV